MNAVRPWTLSSSEVGLEEVDGKQALHHLRSSSWYRASTYQLQKPTIVWPQSRRIEQVLDISVRLEV